MIGYQFMGKAHSNAYRQVGRFFDLPCEVVMHTLCGRTEGPLREAADQFGWANTQTDWQRVVEDPDIDLIDVSVPGHLHAPIAIAAAKAGKAVLCEKPLANTLAEAQKMLAQARDSKVFHGLFHNYRFAPAVALARQIIDEGRLGEVRHIRAVYLQDWIVDPQFPRVWRLQRDQAGSGVHGDLNAHLIDLARYLVGEFDSVCGHLHTFIAERPLPDDPTQRGPVDVDDAAMFLAKFQNGARGTFEATRFATGRKNANRFEINGSKGSVAFDLERMNELEFFDAAASSHTQGFQRIQVTQGDHPYAGRYWPAGHILGYEHTFVNLISEALTAMRGGAKFAPNFEDGVRNQRVLHAVEQSHLEGAWVSAFCAEV